MAKNDELNSHQYKMRYTAYFEQVYCTLNSLSQLFEAMKTNGIYERSIIVIHGDHGSLIGKNLPRYSNLELLRPEDYRAHFSTLFAIKFPGQPAKINNDVLPIGLLLEAFSKLINEYVVNPDNRVEIEQMFSNDSEKLDPYVYLLGTTPQKRVDIDIFADQD